MTRRAAQPALRKRTGGEQKADQRYAERSYYSYKVKICSFPGGAAPFDVPPLAVLTRFPATKKMLPISCLPYIVLLIGSTEFLDQLEWERRMPSISKHSMTR